MPRPKNRKQMQKGDIKKSSKTLKRVFALLFKRYGIQMTVVVICIVVAVLCSVQGTLFMQTLIDDYITPMVKTVAKGGQADFGPLAKAMMRIAGFYIAGIVTTFVYNLIMVYVTQGVMASLREEMFEKMEDLPIKYFDSHSHGDIMSLYTNDIDTMRQMISQALPQFINSGITIVAVVISMFKLNWILTLVNAAMVAIMLVVTTKVAGKSGTYFGKQQAAIGKVNGHIEEMMNGQKVIQVFTHEDEAIEGFAELNQDLFENAYSANKFSNIIGPINGQLGNLSYVVIAVVGGALALMNVGSFTIGALASFLTFNKSLNAPITSISQQLGSIVMAMAGAERVFAVIDEEPEVDDGYVTLVNAKEVDGKLTECTERTGTWAWKHTHQADGSVDYVKLEGDVVFDDVDFGYNDDKMVLHNIELFATPGQKIAFVGATGAGKTTITNLINRFYDIQDGKIRYDGINVNKIKKADLRKSLGIVLQDTHLFTGTVADNIRYGKLDATDEEVIAAAKLANAHGFISKLENGYDTVIKGDGAALSQGQKQLLAIARAAIADPPVLILDEATSSIDTRTERMVQDGMDKLMKGRTTFVIAHRLSTIQNSDCIMVLDNGRIIERGNHDELIQEGGKYYQLYTGKIVNA